MDHATVRPRGDDAARFRTRFGPAGHRALTVLPLILAGILVVVLTRPTPTLVGLAAGAEAATPDQLTASAAEILTSALTAGPGIEFEIVQTSTITAKGGEPLVSIPDPADRTRTLGETEHYVVATLVSRGLATPDGFWAETIRGPAPGKHAEYQLDGADVSREALVRDGTQYRTDAGHGWHAPDRIGSHGIYLENK